MTPLRPSFYTFRSIVLVLLFDTQGFSHAFQIAPVAATAWTWYKSMLTTRPLLTKSLTSSCIMTISDVMCQKLMISQSDPAITKDVPPSFDWQRTIQVALTGLVWSGPITHYWYAMLERIYDFLAQSWNIQNPAVGLVVKLLLDATLFSPIVVMGYFVVRSILEGKGAGVRIKEKLKTKFKPTLIGAWKFWPAVNSINFYFVPLQFRVLYMNVLSLVWSGYLTYVNSARPDSTTKTKNKRTP